MQGVRYDPDDPLAAALAPPPGESAEERAARVRREEEAKRVNDEIDERLREERAAWKRRRSDFKLLLLGQSESGTSPVWRERVLPTPSPRRVVQAQGVYIGTQCGDPARLHPDPGFGSREIGP